MFIYMFTKLSRLAKEHSIQTCQQPINIHTFMKQKLKPDADAEMKERLQEARQDRSAVSETSASAPGPAQTPGLPPISSNTTVTNSSDLNDTREINFEYLKHVVLKFMSSREAEVNAF